MRLGAILAPSIPATLGKRGVVRVSVRPSTCGGCGAGCLTRIFATADSTIGDWGADYSRFGLAKQDLTLVLHIAAREPGVELSPFHRYSAGLYLNKLIPARPFPLWWLNPQAFRNDDFYRARLLYRDNVSAQYRAGGLLDWLLMAMSESALQENLVWLRGMGPTGRVASPDHQVLLKLARQRVAEGGGLEWWVMQAMLEVPAAAPMDQLNAKVAGCTATDAEYAAEAVRQYYDLYRDGLTPDLDRVAFLSPVMQLWALKQIARQALDPSTAGFDPIASRALLVRIAEIWPDWRFPIWLNTGRTWLADSVPELIAIHKGTRLDTITLRTLNALSFDDLAQFADGVILEDPKYLTPILTALVGRAMVLDRPNDARRYLRELQGAMPDHAAGLAAALAVPGGSDVQNARAFLALPQPSVWLHGDKRCDYGERYCKFSSAVDPLPYFADATFLNADLNAWLKEPYLGNLSVGYDPEIYRSLRRGNVYGGKGSINFLGKTRQDGPFPFQKLIAWDEISGIDVCHGTTQHVSATLIHYVDYASSGPWDRTTMDSDDLSWLLRQIILLNARNPGALVDGKPAGQRAYALLTTRFADTPAAQATKYWYYTDQGCQP